MEFIQTHKIDIDFSLNDLELKLKELFLNNKEVRLDTPIDFAIVNNLLFNENNIFESTKLSKITIFDLDENSFFDDNMDVAIYKHLRFLPSYFHKHVFFEVLCVVQGSCTNYICNNELNLHSGDICIIPPNTEHAISAFSEDTIIFNILLRTSTFEETFLNSHKDTDLLSTFFTQTLYNRERDSYLLVETGNDYEVFKFIIYAYDEMNNNFRYKNRMLVSIITAFFLSILRKHEKNFRVPDLTGSVTNTDIIYILRYLQEHYNTITMRELSSFFNYSERQMQRILQTYTGLSFTQNIKKMKMTHASVLLKNTDLSVAKISENLGFCDVSNFRREFKKFYGDTPQSFR